MLNTPFAPWPSYDDAEIAAVAAVLRSNQVNYWTGHLCRDFEREFAAWSDCSHAVALANGTVALDLAFKALRIGPGDEVVVTPRTFLASVSSIVNAGATPIFADVDRDSQNITAESIAAVLSARSKAIVCVHLAGWPCAMESILQLADAHHLKVIEDCAQAHGARYQGRSVGAWGDIGAWSFCQDKIMTTGGEGGMVTTQDEQLWSAMWSYKDHGKSFAAVYQRSHPPGFRWLHEQFGTNWRLTEMQAAIGLLQLQKMAQWHQQRRANAQAILAACAPFSALRCPQPGADCEHAWYKCYVFVRPAELRTGWSRDRIMNTMVERGVPCYSGSCSEVYLEKAFDNTGLRPALALPVAHELGETSLMFLVHPSLTVAQLVKTCDVVTEVMQEANR